MPKYEYHVYRNGVEVTRALEDVDEQEELERQLKLAYPDAEAGFDGILRGWYELEFTIVPDLTQEHEYTFNGVPFRIRFETEPMEGGRRRRRKTRKLHSRKRRTFKRGRKATQRMFTR